MRSLSYWALAALLAAGCDRATSDGASRGGDLSSGSSAGGASAAGAGDDAGGAAQVEASDAAGIEPPRGGGEDASASATASDAGPTAVVGVALSALRFVPTPEARGPDAQVDLSLREDGAILRRGTIVARFEGERLIDAQGREVLRLAPDRVVVIAGMRTTHRLNEQGELRRADGRLLRVEDDGRVTMIGPNGARDTAPMRVEGFTRAARATASLLCVYLALQP